LTYSLATHVPSGITQTATVRVTVSTPALEAQFEGGNYRLVSPNCAVVLDATPTLEQAAQLELRNFLSPTFISCSQITENVLVSWSCMFEDPEQVDCLTQNGTVLALPGEILLMIGSSILSM
jgi:hypothetical protein